MTTGPCQPPSHRSYIAARGCAPPTETKSFSEPPRSTKSSPRIISPAWSGITPMVLDLSSLYNLIKSVEGNAGRPPIDPKILMALWLYATIDGVGSARQLDELCRSHSAYQWICGDVSVNYHTLSDFRTDHGELLDQLLSQSVAVLLAEGLVDLNRVAQDGMRVRASAGAASFRRRPTLEEALAEAEAQIQALRAELEEDPAASNRRQQKARERATRERAQRIKGALDRLPPGVGSQRRAEKIATRPGVRPRTPTPR